MNCRTDGFQLNQVDIEFIDLKILIYFRTVQLNINHQFLISLWTFF